MAGRQPSIADDDEPTALATAAVRDDVAAMAVHVVAGPDAPLELTWSASEPGALLVGKGPACALRLTDPHVSRRHLSLELGPTSVRLRDLGSSNGTRAQGVDVVEANLRGGELLSLGQTTLQVQLVKSGAPRLKAERSFGGLLGASLPLQRIYPLCHRLAASNVPVLIEGETGTGKEVLAEALHEMGPRSKGPFIVLDCTAIAANLMEAELFGHERGAFTGAVAAHPGVFEQADGGTLFIDEIGDLDPALQPKLLRALERSEFRRIGGTKMIRVDARVIAATRRDLDREVQEGRFRDDLFHRLVVARVELPALRARAGDVSLLARHFFRLLGGVGEPPAEVLTRWESYGWPGNVRELRNAVAARLALGDLAPLGRPDSMGPTPSASAPAGASADHPPFLEAVFSRNLSWPLIRAAALAEIEQRYVERVLRANNGNVVHAAKASGIHRRYLQKMKARKPA